MTPAQTWALIGALLVAGAIVWHWLAQPSSRPTRVVQRHREGLDPLCSLCRQQQARAHAARDVELFDQQAVIAFPPLRGVSA